MPLLHQLVHQPTRNTAECRETLQNPTSPVIVGGERILSAEFPEEPYYVGFNVGGQDIGLYPHGHSKGMTGPVGYWHVDDIGESLKLLLNAGAEAHQEVRNVGGGKLMPP